MIIFFYWIGIVENFEKFFEISLSFEEKKPEVIGK
jgi:hypothetical protein